MEYIKIPLALIAALLFIIILLPKNKVLNILSFCDFEGEKRKNKLKVYNTVKGYNFDIVGIEKIINKTLAHYKLLIRKGEKLFSFEKEFIKNSSRYIEEYKTLKKNLKVFYGIQFFEGVPLCVIDAVEAIHCNLDCDKNTPAYKIARLIVIASFYYISLGISGKLILKGHQHINYRKNETDDFKNTLKLYIKKFYSLHENCKTGYEKEFYLYNGKGRKNHLYTDSADFIADDDGNFCYYKNGKTICGFGKFNFIKSLNFKIEKVFYTDKFCIYQNEKNKTVKICLDISSNLILIVAYEKSEKIYQVKILKDCLKFIPKMEFLHSCLAFENRPKIMPYRLSCLLFNNAKFDMGLYGICLNFGLKGALKALKHIQLFKNVKVITLISKDNSKIEIEKILNYIKIFNRFNYNYYVIAISNKFIKEANECFLPDELTDNEIQFLKRCSVLFFDGKKYKFNLNPMEKTEENNFIKTPPFFIIKSTRLKQLCDILYSIDLKTDDSIFNHTLLNISQMSRQNYLTNRQNILRLFKMQTLEGQLPVDCKFGFVNFEGSRGTIAALYYLYCFIGKYNDVDILKESIRYSVFLQNYFKLETGKISDSLEYHMLIAVQYLIDEDDSKNIENDLFKLFVLKKITSITNDIKIKNKIFAFVLKLGKKLETEIFDEDINLKAFYNFIISKPNDNLDCVLTKIFNLFESNNFKDFENCVLSLDKIKDENQKFLSVFLLKQYLTEKILGIKFNKNLVSFNPNLPKELDMLEVEMCSSKFIIGFFGFFGIEVNSRKYYNYNYISLDSKNDNNVISVG